MLEEGGVEEKVHTEFSTSEIGHIILATTSQETHLPNQNSDTK